MEHGHLATAMLHDRLVGFLGIVDQEGLGIGIRDAKIIFSLVRIAEVDSDLRWLSTQGSLVCLEVEIVLLVLLSVLDHIICLVVAIIGLG